MNGLVKWGGAAHHKILKRNYKRDQNQKEIDQFMSNYYDTNDLGRRIRKVDKQLNGRKDRGYQNMVKANILSKLANKGNSRAKNIADRYIGVSNQLDRDKQQLKKNLHNYRMLDKNVLSKYRARMGEDPGMAGRSISGPNKYRESANDYIDDLLDTMYEAYYYDLLDDAEYEAFVESVYEADDMDEISDIEDVFESYID